MPVANETQPTTLPASMAGPKAQFLEAYKREMDTTRRVLKAYPESACDLKPHETCKSARELAWMFVLEQKVIGAILTNQFKMPPPPFPPPPATFDEVVAAFEAAIRDNLELLDKTPESDLFGTAQFFTAPKTMGEVPKVQLLWFFLSDAIHHRGQLSIYLRMSGAKVPSIYGPSKDEPWT